MLKSHGAQCDRCTGRSGADQSGRPACATTASAGLVVIFPATGRRPGRGRPGAGREHVRQLVQIARELPELPGEPPRLYVVTRCAQAVLPGDQLNLEQAGLRGLLRVIGAEHPQLRPTQIDVDDDSEPEQVAMELLSGSEEDETAWRGGQWYTARLCTSPLAPR